MLIRAEDTRSPKAFLLAVMRNEQAHSQLRLAAAIAVAPYCEAKITDPPLETVVPIIECKTAADAQHNIEQSLISKLLVGLATRPQQRYVRGRMPGSRRT